MMHAFLKLQSWIVTFFLSISFIGFSYEAGAEHLVKLLEVASGFSSPLYVTHAGDNSGRLFIVERAGLIRVVKDGRLLKNPFLRIRNRVDRDGIETGLLGLAFHPDYINNGRFFLYYTVIDNAGGSKGNRNNNRLKNVESRKVEVLKSVIAEYKVSDFDADRASYKEKILFVFEQPTNIHQGGQLAFGPDGHLYAGFGDGGPGADGSGNGQNINTLPGTIVRVDVDQGEPYSIPDDNPFVGVDGADEIFAYGFRNPWRFSFDRLDGRIFCGDVGQNSFEEINLIEVGGNYGWSIMEGNHCFLKSEFECDDEGLVMPIIEYSHKEGQAVVGGYVYRGSELPVLEGLYLFGDYVSGTIWTLAEKLSGGWERTELLQTGFPISSFGEDEDGEIYVVNFEGALFKIVDL